jgi:serine/threonine protein kinase
MDPQGAPRLRKVKHFQVSRIEDAKSAAPKLLKLRRLVRIDFKSPEDDYIFIQELKLGQGTLACHRKNRLYLAIIRESFSPKPLRMLETLTQMQHPNIADIFDVYFHDSKLYIVNEHLDVSLLDLEFNKLALEEWEIATIIAEVALTLSYIFEVWTKSV